MNDLKNAAAFTDINAKKTVDDIKNFRNSVRNALTPEIDFGTIPHTGDKPTLFKSGAEKILKIMHASAEFEVINLHEDWDQAAFGYTIRCLLKQNDNTSFFEGLGACSTLETKYAKQNGFTIQNTVLKMAKKRALVDAVLTASSLSDMFTQDVEDLDEEYFIASKKKTADTLPVLQPTNNNLSLSDSEFNSASDEYKEVTICSQCGTELTDKVAKYSTEKIGRPLCYKCQKDGK